MSAATGVSRLHLLQRESRLEPTDVGCYKIEIEMKTKKSWREKLADNKGLPRIGKVAGELGKGVREIREGLSGKDEPEVKAKTTTAESDTTKE